MKFNLSDDLWWCKRNYERTNCSPNQKLIKNKTWKNLIYFVHFIDVTKTINNAHHFSTFWIFALKTLSQDWVKIESRGLICCENEIRSHISMGVLGNCTNRGPFISQSILNFFQVSTPPFFACALYVSNFIQKILENKSVANFGQVREFLTSALFRHFNSRALAFKAHGLCEKYEL